jgi:hypothetical protein
MEFLGAGSPGIKILCAQKARSRLYSPRRKFLDFIAITWIGWI